MTHTLGRLAPTDFEHVDKYLLTLDTTPEDPTPVVAGTLWYPFMDEPVWDESDRRWYIGRGLQADKWGTYRGGHCYCLKPETMRDLMSWYRKYDQGEEGACCGFGGSRAMSLIDRKFFDAFALYYKAQEVDEWPGNNYSGTSVRATMDVLRTVGASVIRAGKAGEPKPEHGIEVNRWATSVRDINSVLKSPKLEAQGLKCILNSWGEKRGHRGYPHYVYIEDEKVERLIREDGEMTMFTPR